MSSAAASGDWPAFTTYLSDLLALDLAQVRPDDRLLGEVGLDSLALVVALVELEGAGPPVPSEYVASWETFDDLYHYGHQAAAHRGEPPPWANPPDRATMRPAATTAPNRDLQPWNRAPLAGRWVELRPVKPRHYEFLYDLAATPDGMARWRFRGRTPSIEQFAASLTQGVVAQFVVTARASEQPMGLVVAYNGDDRNGVVYLGAQFAPGDDAASFDHPGAGR